jgi:hypothetical protein
MMKDTVWSVIALIAWLLFLAFMPVGSHFSLTWPPRWISGTEGRGGKPQPDPPPEVTRSSPSEVLVISGGFECFAVKDGDCGRGSREGKIYLVLPLSYPERVDQK